MPEVSLNGISFEIKGSADTASDSIDKLVESLNELRSTLSAVAAKSSLGNIGKNAKKEIEPLSESLQEIISEANKVDVLRAKLSGLGKALEKAFKSGNEKQAWGIRGQILQTESAIEKATRTTIPLSEEMQDMIQNASRVDILAAKLEMLQNSMQDAFNAGDMQKAYGFRMQIIQTEAALEKAASAANQASTAVKEIGNSAKQAKSPLKTLIDSLKRIAFYRVIRSIIKSVAKAFSDGLKNAYQFSKINNGALAQSLDTVATKSLTMKNQLGASFGALLTAIAPIVTAIINLITRLATALSMLFAAFGGSTQFKKAKDAWTDWGDAASGAGGAAKEALKYLAPFDELNVLPDDKSGGGGGGNMPNVDDMFDYEELPEWMQNFAEKMGELATSIKITFNDVLFDWSDLTGEQIAEKAIAGIGGLLGAGVGFMLGGVPGAVTGTLIGVSVSVLLSSLIFDHDGVISGNEVKDMLKTGLNGLVGGVIGFILGGPGGALLGVSISLGVTTAIKGLEFLAGNKFSNVLDEIVKGLNMGIGGGLGASAGFVVGGPLGAALGLTIGLGISMLLTGITFDPVGGQPKEVIEEYIAGLDEAFKDAKPGTYEQQYYQHFRDYAVREMESSGSDSGGSFLTKFKEKWDEMLGGKTFGEWLLEGVGDIADNIALIFTGMTWSDLDQWLSDGGELLKGWLEDLPAKFKNAGIKMINAMRTEIIGGLNQMIADINNSGFAQWFGIHFDPLPLELLPEIPPEELTKNYDEAKRKIEERSNSDPPSIGISTYIIPPPDNDPESFSVEDLLGGGGKELSFQAKITKLDLASNLNPPILNSTANFNDWQCYGSKTDSKVRAFTTWKSTANWNDYQVYGSKSGSSISKFTTWSSTANFTKKMFASTIPKDGENPKIDITANITKFSGKNRVDVETAAGGIFKHGAYSNIPQYAGGTTRAHGSMFIAGEAGPEIVGHIGGRTEVLNRSQLAATMYSAVNAAMRGVSYDITAPNISTADDSTNEDALYRAFMRAIADSNLDRDITLDGEPVYRAVVRRNRQNTRATGVNQLAMA